VFEQENSKIEKFGTIGELRVAMLGVRDVNHLVDVIDRFPSFYSYGDISA